MNSTDNTDEGSAALRRPPVRVGIAGLGRSGLLAHVPALESLPDHFAVTAVCDLMKERRDVATMKRNWHLIVIAILFLLVLCYFGTNRVISVNISNEGEIKANHPIVNQK